jgi:hypothetical protein
MGYRSWQEAEQFGYKAGGTLQLIKQLIGAGSENSRLKHWNRGRYGKLQLNQLDMNEYVSYVNIGNDMVSVMHGLSVANGGAVKNEY